MFHVCGQPNLGVRHKRSNQEESGRKRKKNPRVKTTPATFEPTAAGDGRLASGDTSRRRHRGRKQGRHRGSTSTVATPTADMFNNGTSDNENTEQFASDLSTARMAIYAPNTTSSLYVDQLSSSDAVDSAAEIEQLITFASISPTMSSTLMTTTTTTTTVTTRQPPTTTRTITARRRRPRTTTVAPQVAVGRRKGGSRPAGRARARVPSYPSNRNPAHQTPASSEGGSERQDTSHSAFEQIMSDIRSILTASQSFLVAAPERVCADLAASSNEESRCWNGTKRSRWE